VGLGTGADDEAGSWDVQNTGDDVVEEATGDPVDAEDEVIDLTAGEPDAVVDLTDPPGPAPLLDPDDDEVVVQVGSIAAGTQWLHLPGGPVPLQGTSWTVRDQVHTTTQIPSYAIVLAVIFSVVFLLGLLFLLIKETTVEGVVQVGVEGDGFRYGTQVPVASYEEVRDVHHRVKAIRHLAAVA
jgi:hypothetical protein